MSEPRPTIDPGKVLAGACVYLIFWVLIGVGIAIAHWVYMAVMTYLMR